MDRELEVGKYTVEAGREARSRKSGSGSLTKT